MAEARKNRSSTDLTRARSRWKRLTYTLLAPMYDALVRPLDRLRFESIRRLSPSAGERVLIVGAGTGLDLDHLPSDVQVSAVDFTPAMLRRLQQRARKLGRDVDARVMDGHALDFPDGRFDAVILHLILAVIPDPARCLREAVRVLKPGGRLAIMDKFVPENRPVPRLLRLLNPLLDCLGTSVNRKLEPMMAGLNVELTSDTPAWLRGYYRIVMLRKHA